MAAFRDNRGYVTNLDILETAKMPGMASQGKRFYIQSAPMIIQRGYSSGVEHSTADREVPGSIPGVPLFC